MFIKYNEMFRANGMRVVVVDALIFLFSKFRDC